MLGHEVDGVGRRHLRGDDEVALVLAVLGVDQDDHAPVAQILDDLVDRRKEALAFRVCGRLQAVLHVLKLHGPRDVAGKHVDLQVDPVAGLFRAQGGVGQGVGDDVDAEAVVLDLVDGERDAVERDGALGRDEARELAPAPRRVKRRELAVGADVDDAADAVDVPGHDMPAELVAGLERALQVDAPAGLPVAERGLAQRLVGDVDLEDAAAARAADLGRRQAGAVAGDRGADGDAVGRVAAAYREAARPRASTSSPMSVMMPVNMGEEYHICRRQP